MFGLFKNKRKQFNGLVDTKLNNDYQIQTRDNSKFPGVIAYLEFLDIAVSARMNETEAAMYIATMYFCGLCKHGHAQEASALLQRIDHISEFEIQRKTISHERWDRFSTAIAKAREEAQI